jgi:hypothetical protein
MVRTARFLLALAFLGGALAVPEGYAQAPARPSAPAPAPGGTAEPDFLKTLPRPPDEPRSLLEPPPPLGPPPHLEGPYFEPHPLLDPPQFPPPGWFANVEADVVAVHVQNQLTNMVQLPGSPMPDTVGLPSAGLGWTVSPRFEVGYRLPAGFGEFALAYRFLVAEGTDLLAGAVPTRLKSRLDLNQVDLDYISREYSLWPHWDMKWRFGLRLAYLYFDSQADRPFDLVTAAGGGVFEARTTNSFVGFGPHAGVELARRLEGTGLALVGRVDLADMLGRIRQGFFEESTVLGPDGQPLAGQTRDSTSQNVPVLNGRLGLSWQPCRYPHSHFFLGYQGEYWWNVGRRADLSSRGELADHGFVLRAEFNF